MEKIKTRLLDDIIDVINWHIKEIDNKLDNMRSDISNYIKKIDPELKDGRSKDVVYVGIIILEELCKRCANIDCIYDLSKKPPLLYNLWKEDLEELVGRTFLGVMPHCPRSFCISSDYIHSLKGEVRSLIENFLHYKEKENKVEIEKSISRKLKEIYQTVGSEILRKLKEMNMIEIIEIGKYKNPPVHVRIFATAYQFVENYEKYRTTDSEYEYKIDEYD